MADAVALARDLIRCPSVTPAEGGALCADRARAARRGLHGASRDLRGGRHRPDREPLCAHRHGGAAPDVRRPYRRGAARRRGEMDPPAVRRRGRGRRALRPRRRGHERLDRLQDRRDARLSGGAWQSERLDLVPDYRRRGRHRGQRHDQAAAMGGGARREHSTTPSWASRPTRRRSAT